MAVIDYEIWVPSRKRVENCVNIQALLPTAKFFVDEREVDDYANLIDRKKIIPHPPTNGMAEVRTQMIEMKKTDCLIMVDDDLVEIVSLVGRKARRYRDPGVILQVIENGVNVAADIGVKMFSWTRCPSQLQYKAADPFRWIGPASQAIGIIGSDIKPDKYLTNYEDVDMVLQCLLKYRIVMCNNNWYFNFGRVWHGKGGLQGLRTHQGEEKDRAYIRQKWGGYVNVCESTLRPGAKKPSQITPMQIKVQRKSVLASTR